MRANASWPTGDTKKTVWVSEHNALRADMDDLAAAIGALDGQLAAGKALTAWQVRKSGKYSVFSIHARACSQPCCVHRSAGDAMEVECSWSADGGTAIADAVLLRDDAAQHDAAPLPLDVLLMLQPGAAGGPCELTGARCLATCMLVARADGSPGAGSCAAARDGTASPARAQQCAHRGAVHLRVGQRADCVAVCL